MDIGSALLGLALGLMITLIVAQPFLEGRSVLEQQSSPLDQLITEREQLLAALRDLDFDHATGKITNEDYAPQREQLVTQSATVLKQIDDLKPLESSREAETVTALSIEDFIEAEIAARRQTGPTNRPALTLPVNEFACSQCGTSAHVGDRFCPNCGATLAHLCHDCGHTLQPDDRFCARCGAKQAEAQLAH